MDAFGVNNVMKTKVTSFPSRASVSISPAFKENVLLPETVDVKDKRINENTTIIIIIRSKAFLDSKSGFKIHTRYYCSTN
jgi:hypothetical protein